MIQIFVTGGTFDKEYNMISGKLFFRDSHLNEMFKNGRCTVPLNVKTLMMVDSLEMTESDREIIAHNSQREDSKRILITHGTDKMVETATFLAKRGITDKTIVFTGAMIPYAFGTSSDGFFNLGSALAFVQSMPPGVYIVMNGRCYDWDKVRKNKKTGLFEDISENI